MTTNPANAALDDATEYTTFTPQRSTAHRGSDDRPAVAEPEMTLSVPPPGSGLV